jgi:hypothetical protein
VENLTFHERITEFVHRVRLVRLLDYELYCDMLFEFTDEMEEIYQDDSLDFFGGVCLWVDDIHKKLYGAD